MQNNEMIPANASPASLSKDTELTVTVESLIAGGRALARHQGQVIFIDHGLPGQELYIRIDAVKKRYAEASSLKLLKAGADDVPAPCPHFLRCGGCDWQDLDYAAQCHWKQQHVQEALSRIGGCKGVQTQATLPVANAANAEEFLHAIRRNKMEFAFVSAPGATPLLGLRPKFSHGIITVTDCILQSPRAMAALAAVRLWLVESGLSTWDEQGRKGNLRFLVIREFQIEKSGNLENCCIIELITSPLRAAQKSLIQELAQRLEAVGGITGFIHSERKDQASIAYGERIAFSQLFQEELGNPHELAKGIWRQRLGQLTLKSSARSFLQTNTQAAAHLYQTIQELTPLTGQETVWDIYCGVGPIAITLAPKAGAVLGFEISQEAVQLARENALLNGVTNCSFYAGAVEKVLRQEKTQPHVVVADPPRSGMAPAVVQVILEREPQYIVYSSCNPATQARDVGLLAEKYTITSVQPVDMFPHTAHIESVIALKRKT